MNILAFNWRDPKHPLAGGAEQVMHEHMKGWIKSGYDITLFSSRFPGSKEVEEIDKVKVVRKGSQYLGVQLAGFFYYIKNKKQFDMVIDQFHGLPFFTPLFVNKPKLAIIQETARDVWLLNLNKLRFPVNWLVGIVGYIGEPFIFLLYRNMQFMTGSKSAKKDVISMRIPSKNITIIPHGVVIPKLTNLPKKEKIPTVVYLGVLSKDKGIEDALLVFSLLKRHSPLKFWIIGKPDSQEYGQKIKRLISELDLSSEIKMWGFVSQRKKFSLLARAHILLNPSRREGWGLVNIEANAMGTPVVAYDVAGCRDSVIHNKTGKLVKAYNTQLLSNAIVEILANKNLYKKLHQNSKSWASEFDWEKATEKSLKLIKHL